MGVLRLMSDASGSDLAATVIRGELVEIPEP
jgi:hypothetical protein